MSKVTNSQNTHTTHTEWEEEYSPIRHPIALLPRAFLHFVITLICIAGLLYPFYMSGKMQQWAAEIGVFHQGDIGTQGYMALATSDAVAAGIPPNLFVRQINQESGFDPLATSEAGAEGIAQLMPSTASSLGVDPWNPTDSLHAAARVMAAYSRMYGGDYAKALAAYNGGTGTVERAVNECGEAAWMHCLPAETQRYIQAIME